MQQHSITEKTLEIERRKDILCHGEFVNYWLDFGAKYKHLEKKNGTFGVPYRTVPFLQDCPVFTGLSRFYRTLAAYVVLPRQVEHIRSCQKSRKYLLPIYHHTFFLGLGAPNAINSRIRPPLLLCTKPYLRHFVRCKQLHRYY